MAIPGTTKRPVDKEQNKQREEKSVLSSEGP